MKTWRSSSGEYSRDLWWWSFYYTAALMAVVFSLVLQHHTDHHGVKVCACCCLQEWCREKVAALNWPLQPKKIQQNRAFAKYRKIPTVLSLIIYITPYMYTDFSRRSNIVNANPNLCLEDLTIEQMSWYGREWKIYIQASRMMLFGYPTYLCFLLSGGKEQLTKCGWVRWDTGSQHQLCQVPPLWPLFPICEMRTPLSRCLISRKMGRSALLESWFWKCT